jgi:hypothetical protein
MWLVSIVAGLGNALLGGVAVGEAQFALGAWLIASGALLIIWALE